MFHVGVMLGALTLIFLMGLVGLSTAGKQVPCDSRFLVAAVFALGAALASSFLGGSAAAQGAIPLPFAKNHPLQLSVAGGIAVLVIVLVVGSRVYVPAGGCATSDIESATLGIETTAAYQLVADLKDLEPRAQIARLQQYSSAHNVPLNLPELARIEEPDMIVDARMLGRYAVVMISSYDASQLAFVDAWSNRVALWDDDLGGGIDSRFLDWGAGVSPNAIVEVTYPTIRGTGTFGESTKIYTLSDDYVLLSLNKPSFEYNSGWRAFEGELVEFKNCPAWG